MKIRGDYMCVCGHYAADHTIDIFISGKEIVDVKKILKKHFNCGICSREGKCKEFTLQNLDLIEYIAEKKGLI